MIKLKYIVIFIIGSLFGYAFSTFNLKYEVTSEQTTGKLDAINTVSPQMTELNAEQGNTKITYEPKIINNNFLNPASDSKLNNIDSLLTYSQQLPPEEAELLDRLNTAFYDAFSFNDNKFLSIYIEQGLPTNDDLSYLTNKSTFDVLTDFSDMLRSRNLVQSGDDYQMMKRIAPLAFARSIEDFKELYHNFNPEQTIDLNSKSEWPQELKTAYEEMSELSVFNFSSKTATATLAHLKYFELEDNGKDKYDTTNNQANNYALWSMIINASSKLPDSVLIKTYIKNKKLTTKEREIISSLQAGYLY